MSRFEYAIMKNGYAIMKTEYAVMKKNRYTNE